MSNRQNQIKIYAVAAATKSETDHVHHVITDIALNNSIPLAETAMILIENFDKRMEELRKEREERAEKPNLEDMLKSILEEM